MLLTVVTESLARSFDEVVMEVFFDINCINCNIQQEGNIFLMLTKILQKRKSHLINYFRGSKYRNKSVVILLAKKHVCCREETS